MIDWTRLAGDAPEEYIADLCSINLTHLDNSLQNHAALYGYAESMAEAAEAAYARAKKALEFLQAEKFNAYQKREKGLAIARTERRIEEDPDIQEAKDEVIKAQAIRGQLRALCKALVHRRDMLIQISSRQKAERW